MRTAQERDEAMELQMAERTKAWNLPWRQPQNENEEQSNNNNNNNDNNQNPTSSADNKKMKQHQSLFSAFKSCLFVRRRLRFDPDGKLFFIYEPGKQVSSAVWIKNASKSFVAFKFQTNAPKSCFMRPPNGVLAPRESVLATVMKFVEQPEQPQEKKTTKDKFKIVSLKVKEGIDYTPELFEEQKEKVAVERILQVVFLDPQASTQEVEKLRKRVAEAEAMHQARKKPQDNASKPAAPDGVIDEWKERRERYLARQQEELADSE